MNLKLIKNETGKSYWKFNNSLLKDREYIKIVKKTIEDVLETYKNRELQQESTNSQNINGINSNDNNNNNNNNIPNGNTNNEEYTINDQMLLEMIVSMIRGKTIKYSSRKKKEKEKLQKQLEEEIAKLEKSMPEDSVKFTVENSTLLEEKKNRLYELRENIIEGVMIRSRCRYEELGEKPTSYFLNLEKRNFTNKVITKIIEDNGHECVSTNEILKAQKNYYKDLFTEKNEIDNIPIEALLGENPRKLSDYEARTLEGEIIYVELAEALKNMKNSKTPGSDGYTAEFFLIFLD